MFQKSLLMHSKLYSSGRANSRYNFVALSNCFTRICGETQKTREPDIGHHILIVAERFEFVKKSGDTSKPALSFLSTWPLSLSRLLDRIEPVTCTTFSVTATCRLSGSVWMISPYITLNDRRRTNTTPFLAILHHAELFYRSMDRDISHTNN